MVQYLPPDDSVFDTSNDVQGCTTAAGAWMRRNGKFHWLEAETN